MSLEDLRQQIDSIDREIVERLNQRVLLASEIGNIKAESGADMYVPVREEEVFRKLEQLQVDGPLDSEQSELYTGDHLCFHSFGETLGYWLFRP